MSRAIDLLAAPCLLANTSNFSLLLSPEMEEELVRPLPRQPERHRSPRVLRLTLRWRRGPGRRLGQRVQREVQEAGQEDHPPVGVHFHLAGTDGELSKRQHVCLLCGNQR